MLWCLKLARSNLLAGDILCWKVFKMQLCAILSYRLYPCLMKQSAFAFALCARPTSAKPFARRASAKCIYLMIFYRRWWPLCFWQMPISPASCALSSAALLCTVNKNYWSALQQYPARTWGIKAQTHKIVSNNNYLTRAAEMIVFFFLFCKSKNVMIIK